MKHFEIIDMEKKVLLFHSIITKSTKEKKSSSKLDIFGNQNLIFLTIELVIESKSNVMHH